MHSPIHLEDHKILRVNLDTRDFKGDHSELTFSHSIAIENREGSAGNWLVRLDVHFKPAVEGNSSPYIGEIAVVGIFSLSADFPPERSEDIIYMNGGAILYGMVREILGSLTSRGIHGQLLVPTLDARSFLPLREEDKEKASSEKAQTTSNAEQMQPSEQ